MAEHSHQPLIEVSPPFAEHLADHAPPINLYAPRALVGRPADSHIEPYWRGKFRRGDDIRYAGDLHSPREGTLEGPKPSDPRCHLHIVAYGDLDHSVPAPDFSVALVVLSDGKPFDLTVFDMTYHWNLAPIRQYLWLPYKPAKFTSAAKLRPKGQTPILCDFASEEMKAKIVELVRWCQPYDTVHALLSALRYRQLTLSSGSATSWDASGGRQKILVVALGELVQGARVAFDILCACTVGTALGMP